MGYAGSVNSELLGWICLPSYVGEHSGRGRSTLAGKGYLLFWRRKTVEERVRLGGAGVNGG